MEAVDRARQTLAGMPVHQREIQNVEAGQLELLAATVELLAEIRDLLADRAGAAGKETTVIFNAPPAGVVDTGRLAAEVAAADVAARVGKETAMSPGPKTPTKRARPAAKTPKAEA